MRVHEFLVRDLYVKIIKLFCVSPYFVMCTSRNKVGIDKYLKSETVVIFLGMHFHH